MLISSLETPFGAIGVTVNGKSYKFDCREETYSYQNLFSVLYCAHCYF